MKCITNILAMASAMIISMPAMAETNRDTLNVATGMPYFDQIEVSNINVQYEEGEKSSITLYSDQGVEVELDWEVIGDRLIIKRSPENAGRKVRKLKVFGFRYQRSYDCESYMGHAQLVITGPALKGCYLHGPGNTKIDKLVSDGTVNVFCDGAHNPTIGMIEAPKAYFSASGACNIKATTRVKDLSVGVSGASEAYIYGDADHVSTTSSGASNIYLTGNYEDFSGNASGASNITVTGTAKKKRQSSTGASSISFR